MLSSQRGDGLLAIAVFLVCTAVYVASPNVTSNDSRWVVPVALSLLHRGDLNLDEYTPRLAEEHFYLVECVAPGGAYSFPVTSLESCRGGHFYQLYPAAVVLLSAPPLFVIEQTLGAAQPLIRAVRPHLPPLLRQGMPGQFLAGDMQGGAAVAELLIAGLLSAPAAAFLFLAARECLGRGASLLLAGLLAFATPAWSIASRGLWQHGPCMTLLAMVLWLIVKAEADPRWIRWAGLPLALAFYVRPTAAVAVVTIGWLVWRRHRAHLPWFLAGMLPPVVLFTSLNLAMYGQLLAPYFHTQRGNAPGLGMHAEMLTALAGNLISPARGLFVFVPLALLSLYGLCVRRAPEGLRALRPYLGVWLGLHYLLISSFAHWWGGNCYGPRFFTETMPVWMLLLAPLLAQLGEPCVRRRLLAAALALCAACGLFMHMQGATRWACVSWDSIPNRLDEHPERLWDWRDPPFLRGIRGAAAGQPR